MYRLRRQGFTLIEMLIVIVVLAILALIVLPRLLSESRRNKEATLRENLTALQMAVVEFASDCGDYPANLSQLNTKPEAGSKGGRGEPLDVDLWEGPYLKDPEGKPSKELPVSPFLVNALTGKEEPGNAGNGWNYTAPTGGVYAASTRTALDGKTKYSDW